MGETNIEYLISNTDIDIDVGDRERIIDLFRCTRASLVNGSAHNTGIYFHKVPTDPVTKLSFLDYKTAEEFGMFKIDILNVNLYKRIKSREHLRKLTELEPDWDRITDKEFCAKIMHINGHHALCAQMKPTSVEELAAVLAIIRPGKRHLAGKPWNEVMREVWTPPTDNSYFYKKSHAIAYALLVKVNMNLEIEQELTNSS